MNFKTYIKEYSELSWWNYLSQEDREEILSELGVDKRSAQYNWFGLPLSLRLQLIDYLDRTQEWVEEDITEEYN